MDWPKRNSRGVCLRWDSKQIKKKQLQTSLDLSRILHQFHQNYQLKVLFQLKTVSSKQLKN